MELLCVFLAPRAREWASGPAPPLMWADSDAVSSCEQLCLWRCSDRDITRAHIQIRKTFQMHVRKYVTAQ